MPEQLYSENYRHPMTGFSFTARFSPHGSRVSPEKAREGHTQFIRWCCKANTICITRSGNIRFLKPISRSTGFRILIRKP